MSYDLGGPLKPTPEERNGLLLNSDIYDRYGAEPSRHEEKEHDEPRERTTPSQNGRVARGFAAFILGVLLLAQVSRTWCGGAGATGRPTDPSQLLSNGTHEFKRTVLIVSIDGLR